MFIIHRAEYHAMKHIKYVPWAEPREYFPKGYAKANNLVLSHSLTSLVIPFSWLEERFSMAVNKRGLSESIEAC